MGVDRSTGDKADRGVEDDIQVTETTSGSRLVDHIATIQCWGLSFYLGSVSRVSKRCKVGVRIQAGDFDRAGSLWQSMLSYC